MTNHKNNPAEIYLVPLLGDDHDHIWIEDPAPDEGMKEEDATRYVREDLVPAGNTTLAKRIVELERQLLAASSQRDGLIDELNKSQDAVLDANIAKKAALSALSMMQFKAVYAYNRGYLAGHHDTVEGSFVDIHHLDQSSYNSDVVQELIGPFVDAAENLREVRAEAVEHALNAIGVPCTQFKNQSADFTAGFNFCGAQVQLYAERVLRGEVE